MRRFLLHVLPRGFVKVRHFGLYAAGNVNAKLAAARAALDTEAALSPAPASTTDIAALDWRQLFRQLTGIDLGACPHCGCALTTKPLSTTTHASRAPPSLNS